MELNRRILIVDDNEAIHGDFKKVLAKPAQPDDGSLDSLEASILGETGDKRPASRMPDFRLDFAFQGQEALSLVEKANAEGSPYSVIFMDVRMPPGGTGWRRHAGSVQVSGHRSGHLHRVFGLLARSDCRENRHQRSSAILKKTLRSGGGPSNSP